MTRILAAHGAAAALVSLMQSGVGIAIAGARVRPRDRPRRRDLRRHQYADAIYAVPC